MSLQRITLILITFCVGSSAIGQDVAPRKLYVHVFMHHYVGGGGSYPSAQDLRAFADLTQKYRVPATFFFDGILVERLQEEDPTIFEHLNRLKVPLGYHGEESHGPYPVSTCLLDGRLPPPLTRPVSIESSLTYGRPWNEGVEAVLQRYSHRIVPGPVNPDTKQMDMSQDRPSDLTRIGGLALVRKAFGRDVSIIIAHSIESAPAGYAFQQMSGFLLEQPSAPTVGAYGVMGGTPPELIEQGLSIAGAGNDFFWFMNRLNYKYRQRPAGNLPFHFKEVILTAWPPRGMAAIEEQLQQLITQVKAVPGSRFITPDELAGLFEPQNARPVGKDELRRMADKLIAGWTGRPPDFVDLGAQFFSLVNAYEALAKALAHYSREGRLPSSVTITDLYGPIAEREEVVVLSKEGRVPLAALCAAASQALEETGRLKPRRVPIHTMAGDAKLNAAEFLLTMARGYRALAGGSRPASVDVEPSATTPPYADVIERLFSPSDERPLCYSKLQLWTVKPASLKTPNGVQPSNLGNFQGAR